MNKRTSLASLLDKKKSQNKTAVQMTVTGLTPYAGSWEFKQAAHLLRRTTFGPTWEQIQTAVNDGLQNTIAELLALNPLSQMPDPPINYYFENEPDVPIGETWINVKLQPEFTIHRRKSLQGWTTKQIIDEGTSLTEKMTLFWHNHYATGDFPILTRYKYKYISTIRANALGNFKELTKLMTIDPLMLVYLNGQLNTEEAPNENYARELLELFTIGKGPIIAPGDYTNYTESDIAEIAKILTGWRITDTNNQDLYTLESHFIPNDHDNGDKQLSNHFNNEVISDTGENEYSHLIDIIFQQDEVSRFICRNIYRWFVHHKITTDIEINIIEPLAQVMRDNNYEVAPVLECLLTSQHFYDEEMIGCMVKSPWDFTASLIKQFEPIFPTDPAITFETYRVIFQGAAGLQMEYYNPPSVAGWKAYYQAPAYYRIWLNSVTLPIRDFATTTFSSLGIPTFENGSQIPVGVIEIDYLQILNNFSNPFDVNAVIDDFVKLLFPKDIEQDQKNILKEVLIPGLPDFEWSDEYSLYIGNPSDTNQANAVKTRVRNLVGSMLKMPEYQLM